MIPLTVAELTAAVSGRPCAVDPATAISAVTTDSRQAGPGTAFVALAGERVDGHDFAAGCGAAVALVEREVAGPCVVVASTVTALGLLASEVRRRLPALRHVVALTGSSGKTSTKDLLAQVLEQHATTLATQGNLNNEIGLPLTVCAADESTELLVLEMGARGRGHIRQLCEIARPDVGLVLNVGTAHLGEFGSREMVAEAKGEILEGVALAVLNADDPVVLGMRARTEGRVVTFGRADGADYRAVEESTESGRARFTLVHGDQALRVRLPLVGAHHVPNALAVAAVAGELGVPLPAVVSALETAQPRSRWRMEVTDLPSGVTVVNDAYNANPESMAAGLRALVDLAGPRRTWAVLAHMAELGEQAEESHLELGRFVAALAVSRLVVVGDEAAGIHAGAVESTWEEPPVRVSDAAAALELLQAELRPGDVVLVKGSRVAGLERVADGLVADGPVADGLVPHGLAAGEGAAP